MWILGRLLYIHWLTHLYHAALDYTHNEHPAPLDQRETYHIAKSVAHWVWIKFDIEASDRRFSARQAQRGRRGGIAKGKAYEQKRASARLQRSTGVSYNQIAAELGVSRRSVINWCK